MSLRLVAFSIFSWTSLCLLLLVSCGPAPLCLYNKKTHEAGASFPSTDGCNDCTCGPKGQVSCIEKSCATPCGGPDAKTCPRGQRCVLSVGQCGADAPGVCAPDIGCKEDATRVCGCDGVTKDCAQAATGPIAAHGACAPCTAGGKSFDSNSSFPATDRCNTCTCNNGEITCTKTRCVQGCKKDQKSYKHGESYRMEDGCVECTCDTGAFSCKPYPCKKPCNTTEGKVYQPGQHYVTGDGCEECTCGDAGRFQCKDLPCGDCTYQGKSYKLGDTFPANDGCNSCTCKGGQASCTTRECPRACGNPKDPACRDGEICLYSTGGDCKVVTGFCRKRETCGEEDLPVCGCDGKTYLNSCSALQLGIKIHYLAKCAEQTPCGTRGAAACESAAYCNQPGHCGHAGKGGLCAVKPSSCDAKKEPICGCDGNTYDNPCKAAMAGVSIKFEGACQ